MTGTRVLVANEPRSYREAIAIVFRRMRPDIEVVVTDPDVLDADVERYAPNLVVCSRATEKVRSHAAAWIELHPGGEARSVVNIEGRRSTLNNLQLSDLLSAVDQVVDDV